MSVHLLLTTAKAEAAILISEPMDSDGRVGQRFVPRLITVRYTPVGATGWAISTIWIAGPIIRKRGGGLGTRSGYVLYSSAPTVATLPQAPVWAREFAERNLPGGAR